MVSGSGSGSREQTGASTRPAVPKSPPKMLGKYELRKKIGAGGMGTVYLAFDTQLKRNVALKMLSQEKNVNSTLVRRFQSEAQAAAQLKHDNIVMIYEAGQIDDFLFIALEYVDGTDVFKLVSKRGVLPVKRSLDIIKQVARALKHADDCNIVHRDIKPSNLLIQRNGNVKLTDMGLARSVDETTETDITRAGMTVGTVDYMAPEQARNSKQADVRSDIYSLGCTWYHMLTGCPPFNEGSVTNKLYGHASEARPDPRDKNEAVPVGVVDIMLRMMACQPADRYQTPEELLAALDKVDTRTSTSSDKLLATISDAVESETNDSIKTGTTSEASRVLPKRSGAVIAPAPTETDREWIKFTAIGGGLIGFVAFVIWIISEFASGIDGPGMLVTRGDGNSHSENSDGGGPRPPGGVTNNGTAGSPSRPSTRPNRNTKIPERKSPRAPSRVTRRSQDSELFHGATDPDLLAKISIGRKGEKIYMPAWIAGTPDPLQPRTSKLPILKVGRVDGGPSQFANFKSALDNLPPSGALIQLIGDGPFDLPPTTITGGMQVIIIGAGKSQPVIVFQPDPENPATPVLTVAGAGTSLSLLNVHLTASSRRFGQDGPVTLIDVRAADLVVRHCSVTLMGSRKGPTVAFRTSLAVDAVPVDPGKEETPPPSRLFLDQTYVRGNELTAVAVGAGGCDLLAVNCLFAVGSAPIASVSGSVPIEDDESAASKKKRKKKKKKGEDDLSERILRFMSCTGLSTRTAFEFVPGSEGDKLPVTRLLSLNSLFTVPRVDRAASFIVLRDWPQHEAQPAGESRFRNLHCDIRSTLCLRWANLLRFEGEPPMPAVTGAAQWQSFWNRPLIASKFLESPWPAGPAENPASLMPTALDVSKTNVSSVFATDGGQPGCSVAAIGIPDVEVMRRAESGADRPLPPASMFQRSRPAKVVRIDLNKRNEDLGRVVSGSNWPDGTLFIATGSGPRKSSRIQVRGKSLRIEFRQGEGPPLQISTRPINPNSREGPQADSFISVTGGGRIEIAHAYFRIPRSTTIPYASWMLYAEDGDFLLGDCYLEGPIIGLSRFKGLVHWAQPANAPLEQLDAGRYSHYGEIRNSYLKGSGKLFQLDIPGRAFLVRNSLLVCAGILFDLNIKGKNPKIQGAIDIDQATLSATDTLFKISTIPRNVPSTRPLRLFVNRTIFAPLVNASPSKRTALLTYTVLAARSERQVQWWGKANGFAQVFGHYLEGPAEVAGGNDDLSESWRKAWGTTGCIRPLTSQGTVAFRRKLPETGKLIATDFKLHQASKATTWTTNGMSIGADIAVVAKAGPDRSARPKPKPPSKTKKPSRKPAF